MMLGMMIIPIHIFSQKSRPQHLPEFRVDDYSIGLYSFFDILDDYMKNRIGIIDSVERSNDEEGEGYESTVEFQLKGGHRIIDNVFYEHWESNYIFSNVRVKEVYSLLESLLKQADFYDKAKMDELKENGHVLVGLEDLCCHVEIQRKENEVLLIFLPSE